VACSQQHHIAAAPSQNSEICHLLPYDLYRDSACQHCLLLTAFGPATCSNFIGQHSGKHKRMLKATREAGIDLRILPFVRNPHLAHGTPRALFFNTFAFVLAPRAPHSGCQHPLRRRHSELFCNTRPCLRRARLLNGGVEVPSLGGLRF
jgi:hypothetical protein